MSQTLVEFEGVESDAVVAGQDDGTLSLRVERTGGDLFGQAADRNVAGRSLPEQAGWQYGQGKPGGLGTVG